MNLKRCSMFGFLVEKKCVFIYFQRNMCFFLFAASHRVVNRSVTVGSWSNDGDGEGEMRVLILPLPCHASMGNVNVGVVAPKTAQG